MASLRLCAAAGMVQVGTKLAGNAADKANRTLDKLDAEVAEILCVAVDADRREDAQYGDARGDELPEPLASKAGRLRPAAAGQGTAGSAGGRTCPAFRRAGRRRCRGGRGERQTAAAAEAPEAGGGTQPTATANVTAPDSRLLHTRRGRVQGYNAQAATTLEQVVVAAELTQDANDFQQLQPMLEATAATLTAAGIAERPARLAADSGYRSIANLTQLPGAPKHGRHGKPARTASRQRPRSGGLRAAMTAKLKSEDGKACWRGEAQAGTHAAGARSSRGNGPPAAGARGGAERPIRAAWRAGRARRGGQPGRRSG